MKQARVLTAILTHQAPDQVGRMLEYWAAKQELAELWVVYGGTRENFESIDYERKVYVEDSRLRTRDHQRERQSYCGVFASLFGAVKDLSWDYLFFTEFDQIPLVENLPARLLSLSEAEDADLLCTGLRRLDQSSQPHALAHLSDPRFMAWLHSFSLRRDGVILSAYGFGQFWRRAAFEEALSYPDGREDAPKVYLELWGPSVAHHLGYRVRPLKAQDPFNHFRDAPAPCMESLVGLGAWMAHPYKHFWDA